MSHELIYTSVAQGLRPGTRGFCAVAQTNGIPAVLLERLESISGYRHLFEPHTAQAQLNPVAWSYLRITAANARFQVLSRVADAGLDYSQRTNKLAHHLACNVQECPIAGPAAALRQPGLMLKSWTEKPHVLSEGRLPQKADRPAQPCQQWQRVMGDAGWAGLLAETVVNKTDAYVIYQPGLELLDLFVEAIALLPAEQRWEATFQTYYTRLPPGIECRWRGIVAGSEEEVTARRSPNALLIDTTCKVAVPRETPAVLAARAGQPLPIKTAAAVTAPALPGAKAASAPPMIRNAPPDIVPNLPALEPRYEPLSALLPPSSLPAWDPNKAKLVRRSNTRFYVFSTVAVLLLCGGVLGGMYAMGTFDTPPALTDSTPAPKPEPPKQVPVEPSKESTVAPQGKSPEQLQAEWEMGARKSLEDVINKYVQLETAKNKLQGLRVEAQNPANVKPGLIRKLNNAAVVLENQVKEFEKIWGSFKETETYHKKDQFLTTDLQNDFTKYDTKPAEFRSNIDLAKKEIADLEATHKNAGQQASQDKNLAAIDKAIQQFRAKPFLELGVTKSKDGIPSFAARGIDFEIPNPKDIQLELLNLPDQYKLNSKLTLIKNPESRGGDPIELGQFSLSDKGLIFEPKKSIPTSLNELAPGLLRIIFGKDENKSATLYFGKPKINHDGLAPFENSVRIPISQLTRVQKIDWAYQASNNEDVRLVAKIVSIKGGDQDRWQPNTDIDTNNAIAPLTKEAQQRLQFSWSFKREGKGEMARTVLQFQPLAIHFSKPKSPLSDAQLDSWLSDTLHGFRKYQEHEKERKKKIEKAEMTIAKAKGIEKDNAQAELNNLLNERKREHDEIDERWLFEWMNKYVHKVDETPDAQHESLAAYMREKYAPLINDYQLEIRAYRKILAKGNEEPIYIELPYNNK